MKTLFIDGEKIKDIGQLYDLFSKELDFPKYFGRNLDARYDCLHDIYNECGLIIANRAQLETALERRAKGFFGVLSTITEEKPNIHILIEPFAEIIAKDAAENAAITEQSEE